MSLELSPTATAALVRALLFGHGGPPESRVEMSVGNTRYVVVCRTVAPAAAQPLEKRFAYTVEQLRSKVFVMVADALEQPESGRGAALSGLPRPGFSPRS